MGSYKNKLDRKSNLINHVRAASEGAMLFVWISIPKTPMKQVKDSKETAMFYTNKVLTEFKSRSVLLLSCLCECYDLMFVNV